MEDFQTLRTSLGHQITVFADDHIGKQIALHGLYEQEDIVLLLSLLDSLQDPVVLDIGANIGNHTLALSTRAHQIHAFEPIPQIFALLQRNIAQNGLQNVQIHNVALSDSRGTDVIYSTTEGNCGSSSFDRREFPSEAVPVTKVVGDEYLSSIAVDRVDLMKIDVEAHEAYVLRGLIQTLRRCRPLITMEWNDPLTIQRLTGSAELEFLSSEYNIYALTTNHDRAWWTNKRFAFIRRKAARSFSQRRAVLLPFDPKRIYKNLLLVPKERASLLAKLGRVF